MPDPLQKLPPLLEVINTLILQALEVRLGFRSDGALQVLAGLGPVKLQANGAPGITFEQVDARVESLRLPSLEHPDLAVTLCLDLLDMVVHSEFFDRAAVLAKQGLVKNFASLVDRVELREARVTVTLRPDKVADIQAVMASCRVRARGELIAEVLTPDFQVLGFDLAEKDKKKALARARVRLQSLQVRVPSPTFQAGWDAVKSKVPSAAKLNEFGIRLSDGLIKINVRSGWLPMSFPVEVRLLTSDNRFGVQITRLMGLARPLVLKGLDLLLKNRPEVDMQGDSLWIDPWPRIPIPVEAQVERFEVDGDTLVVQFAQLDEPVAALPAEGERLPAAEPQAKTLAPPLP